MKLNTTTARALATKLQAMGSALVVTLAMLVSINGLATSQPPAALVAHMAASEHS